MITRKEITVPSFYANYLSKAGDDDMLKALAVSTKRFRKVIKEIPKKKIDYAYAEGKWTIRQLLQHVIDAERVFALRSLWFARRDPSPQPGFEENIWAENANVKDRKWKDMIAEFLALREANYALYSSLSDEELRREGTSNSNMITSGAFGFISAGHLQHHLDILEERYLNEQPKAEKPVKKKKKNVELTM
jgi:uncharacterized damage-inducible protein DinB